MKPEEEVRLSQSGTARRDAILDTLTEAIHRRQRVRQFRNRSLAIACLGLFIGGAAFILSTMLNRPTSSQPIVARDTTRSSPSIPFAGPSSVILRIESDPSVLDRLRMPDSINAVRLDDDGLLQFLDEIDRPSGIVRIDGRIWLTRAVTDGLAEPTADDPDQS